MVFSFLTRLSRTESLCLIGSGIFLISALAMTTILFRQYQGRFYPDTSIHGIDITGKSVSEARELLRTNTTIPQDFTLTLAVDDITIASGGAELGARYEFDTAVDQAYSESRNQHFLRQVWRVISPLPEKQEAMAEYVIDQSSLQKMIEELAKKVDDQDLEPKATLKYRGVASSLTLSPGKEGRKLEQDATRSLILTSLKPGELRLQPPVASVSAVLTDEQIPIATQRAKSLVGKSLLLRAENVFREITDQELIRVLAFPEGVSQQSLQPIVEELEAVVNRPAQEPELTYDAKTLRVTTFSPPRSGLQLQREQFLSDFIEHLSQLEKDESKRKELTLPVVTTTPSRTLESTNNLGIKEQIGFGESQYDHSIPNRIHNVSLTTNKITNTIIKPGEEYSFNKALGDVSAASGFRSAYVIRNGRTELGDGGGVCQVSTTLFRAVLHAGLPITKRKAHSYRVSYYELNSKPGVDATVYSGEVDLRFVNDTDQHILIHAQADSKQLYMTVELFGTSDGRTTEIVDHKVWDQRSAPAPLYIDDPTLPAGRVRQIDFAASGIKASFTNVVKDASGKEIRRDEYYSNYIPWRAVFLRGVGGR